MKRIVFPLKLQMQCKQVADLHHALALMDLRVDDVEVKNQYFVGTGVRRMS